MSVIEPLSEIEKQQARIVWRVLADRWGKERAMTSSQIIKEVASVTNGEVLLTGPRLRKIISWFRGSGHMGNLISGGGNSGYYRSNDRSEGLKYLKSLNDRIRAMAYTRDRMMTEFGVSMDELSGAVKLDL